MRGQLKKKKKHLHPNKREEPLLLFKCLADFIKFEIRFGRNVSSTFRSDIMRRKKKKGKKFRLESKAVTVIPIYLCQHPHDWHKPATDLERALHDTEGSLWWLSNATKDFFSFFFFNLIYVFPGGTQIHSREGRRWAERRCFPKDKRYVNKQLQRKWKSTLPSCYLAGPPQYCVWGCVPDGVNPRLNDWD